MQQSKPLIQLWSNKRAMRKGKMEEGKSSAKVKGNAKSIATERHGARKMENKQLFGTILILNMRLKY